MDGEAIELYSLLKSDIYFEYKMQFFCYFYFYFFLHYPPFLSIKP